MNTSASSIGVKWNGWSLALDLHTNSFTILLIGYLFELDLFRHFYSSLSGTLFIWRQSWPKLYAQIKARRFLEIIADTAIGSPINATLQVSRPQTQVRFNPL